MRKFAAAVGLRAFGATAMLALARSPSAQTPTPQSLRAMEAAGIKLSFEVASVKLNKSGEPARSNDGAGGLYSGTDTPLLNYISWAYDLNRAQFLNVMKQLPSWAIADGFDIEGRAQGNATKPQKQLMMQSLLADRFKLAVHYETSSGPVFALVLAKAGRLGPQLKPHVNDASCSAPNSGPTQLGLKLESTNAPITFLVIDHVEEPTPN